MKEISILGSTGSVGTQTLEVIDFLGDWDIKLLTTNKNINLLYKQILKYKPKYAVVVDLEAAGKLKEKLKDTKINTELLIGREELIAASALDVDLLVNAVVGFAGLEPSIKAAEAANDIALANKESLVSAGAVLMEKIAESGSRILPLDSEHNAVFQLLKGHQEELSEIILTASGGPFFNYSKSELENVSIADALNHPNWEMGSKITIDSASLMNKGLEVIEAHWLFDLEYKNINILIHPQSIVHSMIRVKDGSILAEMGPADMRIPIQYCLNYPVRKKTDTEELKLDKIASLEFYKADMDKFPALKQAYQAGEAGGTYPAALNAANEEAVFSFLRGEIPFTALSKITAEVMDKHNNNSRPDLQNILAADSKARQMAVEVIKKCY
ncbi:MAG: 1-deoxy-D-xylulose-5-phosphate reductoisomerase [Halanaerobium sp.]